MAEINDRDYMKTLRKLAADKIATTKEKHYLKKKYKVMQYLLSKGYENDLVREVMENED
jgi:regulatory protein